MRGLDVMEGWSHQSISQVKVTVKSIRLGKTNNYPGSVPLSRIRTNPRKLQKIRNDVLSNFPNRTEGRFGTETSAENRKGIGSHWRPGFPGFLE